MPLNLNDSRQNSGNPMLQNKMIERIRTEAREAGIVETMTVSGAINKSGLLFLILAVGGFLGWNSAETMGGSGLAMAGGIIAFILAMMISFMPRMAPFLAPIYALAEGVCLGVISCIFDARWPGIAGNAMFLTFGTLGVMLTLYRFRVLRATPLLQRVVVMGTLAVMVTYVVDMIMGFFGHHVSMIHESSPIGIGFSLIVVGIAAFNLILDFDRIEQAAAAKMPKFMEWYSGFSLLVALVWLYLEMLRLLSKLNNRR